MNKKVKFNELKDYVVKMPSVWAGGEDDEYKVKVVKTTYTNNGSVALILFDSETKEEFDIITVNLEDSLADEKSAYLDTNNCRWAEDFLIKNKLGKFAQSYGYSGFCVYPLYEIAVDKIEEYDNINWGRTKW